MIKSCLLQSPCGYVWVIYSPASALTACLTGNSLRKNISHTTLSTSGETVTHYSVYRTLYFLENPFEAFDCHQYIFSLGHLGTVSDTNVIFATVGDLTHHS